MIQIVRTYELVLKADKLLLNRLAYEQKICASAGVTALDPVFDPATKTARYYITTSAKPGSLATALGTQDVLVQDWQEWNKPAAALGSKS
jgi:hypothetical protein